MKGHKHKTLVSWLFNIRMMVVAVYALHQKRMCSYTLNLSVSVNHSVSNIIGLFLLSYCQLSTIVLDPIWYHVCLLHMDNLHNIRLALISWSLIFDVHTNRCCLCSCTHTLQACNLKCDVIRTSLMPLDCESTALTLWEWHILSDVDVPVSAEIKVWIEGEKRLKTASGMWHQIISQRRLEH